MTGFLVWVGIAVAVALGPVQLGRHAIHRAQVDCRCQCGTLYGVAEDQPPPAADELRGRQSHWFGDHVGVCFIGPIPDVAARLHALQLETDAAWQRRVAPDRLVPGLIPRNGVR